MLRPFYMNSDIIVCKILLITWALLQGMSLSMNQTVHSQTLKKVDKCFSQESCGALFCEGKGGSCFTRSSPIAEGTLCGIRKVKLLNTILENFKSSQERIGGFLKFLIFFFFRSAWPDIADMNQEYQGQLTVGGALGDRMKHVHELVGEG